MEFEANPGGGVLSTLLAVGVGMTKAGLAPRSPARTMDGCACKAAAFARRSASIRMPIAVAMKAFLT